MRVGVLELSLTSILIAMRNRRAIVVLYFASAVSAKQTLRRRPFEGIRSAEARGRAVSAAGNGRAARVEGVLSAGAGLATGGRSASSSRHRIESPTPCNAASYRCSSISCVSSVLLMYRTAAPRAGLRQGEVPEPARRRDQARPCGDDGERRRCYRAPGPSLLSREPE